MCFVGVDLGGTSIATALLDDKGKVLGRVKRDTEAGKGPKRVIQNMIESIYTVVGHKGVKTIQGIGLGIPGLVNPQEGICVFSGNLGWQDIPVVDRFAAEFNVPTFMDNDVRVATLGEKYFGAGRGVDNLICITLGTGVGSGIIIDGRLYRGSTWNAGEIGHTTVCKDGMLCNCGNRGCLELYVSATGIARRAREYIQSGRATLMAGIAGYDLSRVTAKTVSEAYDLGDEPAIRIMKETAEILGIAVANYVNILNPEVVIIGGGVSLAGDRLMVPLRGFVEQRAMRDLGKRVGIVRAELGDESGMIGAGALAMDNVGLSR